MKSLTTLEASAVTIGCLKLEVPALLHDRQYERKQEFSGEPITGTLFLKITFLTISRPITESWSPNDGATGEKGTTARQYTRIKTREIFSLLLPFSPLLLENKCFGFTFGPPTRLQRKFPSFSGNYAFIFSGRLSAQLSRAPTFKTLNYRAPRRSRNYECLRLIKRNAGKRLLVCVKSTREVLTDERGEGERAGDRNRGGPNLCQRDLVHGRWIVRGIGTYHLRFTQFPRYSKGLFLLGGSG